MHYCSSFLARVTFLFVSIIAVAVVIANLDLRPGIGDPEKAEIKIKEGMTKDEVRSVLGNPYFIGADGGDEWDYQCYFFKGTRFRIYFGPNDRVSSREWWLD